MEDKKLIPFVEPTVTLITFATEDIITTSGELNAKGELELPEIDLP